MKHDGHCLRSGGWYVRQECREFSTDGTALGAEIAHEMGTMDEREIIYRRVPESERDFPLTGMEEEQADWEEGR